MQFYLFAANLFTLTAFLLGLSNFSRGQYSWRLVPLFFLVITQSISLIMTLAASSSGVPGEAAMRSLEALTVFSAVCLVWALVDVDHLTAIERRLSGVAAGMALFLSIFPLIPQWPLPFEIHILIITMFGSLLIFASQERFSGLHLLAPFFMGLAALFSLLDWPTLVWGGNLLAYAFLIGALHIEQMQKYQVRQFQSEHIAQEAMELNRERQRVLETTEIINTVPSMAEALSHITRSLVHIADTDLAAVLFLDVDQPNWLHLGAVYSVENLPERHPSAVDVAEYKLLHQVITDMRQQVVSPKQNLAELKRLYQMWQSEQVGPTLFQPLAAHGAPVGILVLGNPVTGLPIDGETRKLCRSISTQIAVIVEAYRRYYQLDLLQQNGSEKLEMEPVAAMPVQSRMIDRFGSGAGLPTEPSAQTIRRPAAMVESRAVANIFESLERQRSLTESDGEGAEPAQPNYYLTILEVLSEGVVVSNANGRVWLANRAAERILDRSRDELLGQPIGTIYGQIDSGESIERLAANFSRRNEPLPTFYEDKERAIQGQLVPWRGVDKEWLGIVAIFKDVTNSVRADRARDNFIYALSRTLREPLAVIKGYAELSLNGQLEDYSPDQLRVQHIIHTSVDRVIEVLNNSIQVNSQTKHKTSPRFEVIDPVEVINEAFEAARPLAQLREVTLKREISSGLPNLTADRHHIYRILENLLSNACRFTPPGGQITLRSWVQEEREGNKFIPHLMISVRDTGVGMAKKDFKRVFEPFFQLDNQNPLEERGMGMGLTVVKELVEAHNGRIWVESALGEGSIFFVALPLAQD
ncbi:MAG: PAS domain-containing protein [Anaerolineae bacterium]|nr:PAS domain-containing protein [Anaerolineae bacterium]